MTGRRAIGLLLALVLAGALTVTAALLALLLLRKEGLIRIAMAFSIAVPLAASGSWLVCVLRSSWPADNPTLLAGTTWYRHGLSSAQYWRWSDAIIHRVHLRELTHIRMLAEKGQGTR